MLNAIGAKEWYATSDTASDAEQLIEVAGRLCYRSFVPGLNPNVTKVREGNKQYIGNLLAQHHGSVLEHATVSFAFLDVSRIFTHEVVRHRPGSAFSQESMRFVRLEDIGMYIPDILKNIHSEELRQKVIAKFTDAAINAEASYNDIVRTLDVDSMSFGEKKKATSALRRIAPGGHSTNIIVTANHRAWRHMIEQRTQASAEEEIRKVFYEVAAQLHNRFPNIYQDMIICPDGIQFEHSKV